MSLGAISIALVAWFFCVGLWIVFGQRRLASAVFIYLVFHFVVFVVRPWVIYQGGEQRFLRHWVGIWITKGDHDRAVILASLGLVAFTVSALIGEAFAEHRGAPTTAHIADRKAVVWVGSIMLLIGIFTYIRYSDFRSLTTSDPFAEQDRYVLIDSSEGYVAISASTAYITNFHYAIIGVLIVWVGYFGVRPRLMLIAGFVLGGYVLLGYSRTSYLIGAFAIGLIVMRIRGRRWPPVKFALIGLVLFVAFASGKSWLKIALIDSPSAGIELAGERLGSYFSDEGETFVTYDSYVAVTYLIPRYALHSELQLYGRPVYGWIPRPIWPGKPIFDFSSGYIQTHIHRVNFQGLAVSMVGESYMAFGVPSVAILMGLWGFFFGYLPARCYRYPPSSLECHFGIALCAVSAQIFRDGMQAITAYMMFYFGPSLVIWIASVVLQGSKKVSLAELAPRGREGLPAPQTGVAD